MATDNLNIVPTKSYTEHPHNSNVLSPPHSSLPLEKNPGVLRGIVDFGKAVFGDFYNVFRLTGYFFESNYSAALRNVPRWLGIKETAFTESQKWSQSDWKVSKARGIINAFESAIFMGATFLAFFRDLRKLKSDIGAVVSVETGKDKVSLGDLRASENPLLQTAMNRYNSLYLLRFTQPLTFLWGLRFGINTTLMEIVAERAAYFEEKSYDKLQKLMREINNNQWGSWSKDTLVARLVDIMQQNRAEHKTPPIQMKDLELYFPLLNKVADRMLTEKWTFADTSFVLGQIIKEPGDTAKAQQAFNALETYQLAGLTRMKRAGQWPVKVPAPANENTGVMPANDEPGASIPQHITPRTPERPIVGAATGQLAKKAQAASANMNQSTQPMAS